MLWINSSTTVRRVIFSTLDLGEAVQLATHFSLAMYPVYSNAVYAHNYTFLILKFEIILSAIFKVEFKRKILDFSGVSQRFPIPCFSRSNIQDLIFHQIGVVFDLWLYHFLGTF